MITYVSLFSGIGGFDLGFDRAGMICRAQVEWDAKARAVLAYHWPNVKRYEDVRHVGKATLPAVDVVCGGFPCQDVSVAGRRAGLAGERSGLWFEFLRIVTELTPRWVVIENVPGLLSSNGGRDFATVIYGMVKCGYRVGWRVLDAQYFGVPQRRRRVFIVAGLATAGANPAEVLFEREGCYWDFEPGSAAREGAATNAANGAGIYRYARYGEYTQGATRSTLRAEAGGMAHDLLATSAHTERMRGFGDYAESSIAKTIQAHDNITTGDLITFNSEQTPKTARNVRLTLRAEYQAAHVGVAFDVRNLRANGDVSGTLQSKATGGYSLNYINPIVQGVNMQGGKGRAQPFDGCAPTLTADDQAHAIAFNWYAGSSHGMAVSEDIAPTLQVSDGHAPAVQQAHEYGVRRLTPVECERLQGFPDNWTAVNGQSDGARYKQLGNAVCVNVAEWLGQRIAAVEWRRLRDTACDTKAAA